MASVQPRYSKEEFAQRGDEIYEREVAPRLRTADQGKFVVIDIETGDFELDPDELAASDRLLARRPAAQIWLRRAGSRFAHRLHGCGTLLERSGMPTSAPSAGRR